MNKTIVALNARINKLDTILFARENEDENPVARGVAGAATGAGLVAGGAAAKRVIGNRLGGMRSTVPGFTMKPRLAQVGAAAASVGRDYLDTAKNTARTIGKKLSGLRRVVRMSAKPTDRVLALSAKAESGIVEFRSSDDDSKAKRRGAIVGGTLAAGGLGLLGHANVQMRGGYGKVGGEIAGASRRAAGAVKKGGANAVARAREVAGRVLKRK
jgi:hypothetical protein